MLDNLETKNSGAVRTVLGLVPTQQLGIVLIHESLLSVVPGAQFAPEIEMDRSKIFEELKRKLTEFRRVGGKTIVDRSGMFHGRDVKLYETLSKTTGVHIVASTGLGPEPMLSGYFLTPQKNPPTPWSAEQFADLFVKEVTEGIVVPRIERSGLAGLVTSIASQSGISEKETSLFRGSAQAARATGVPVSVQYGTDAVNDLEILLGEGIEPNRVIIGGLDRLDAAKRKEAFAVARRGAYIALDHVGWTTHEGYVSDVDRAQLVAVLFAEGLGDRVLISTNAVGVAKGHEAKDLGFDYLLTKFVPILRKAGVTDEQVRVLLEENPQRVLTAQLLAAAEKESVVAAEQN
ncbi:aryldialkylphosphatase [Neobacillus bataviensis LMG 21833]|uniref:Aryldialkylphosphatase n=1 Tax=Neobacillus bataviensis LMG 21833 TaxID=1117379 RepID=K6DEX1_9BACI|nr:aryldialkylphosphatase [Neobacillus bataviensis]EKN66613.1 aryldialkylphosphatase [Neobacillus bataviensis LMG 21833]